MENTETGPLNIRLLGASEVLPLRAAILRPGKPESDARFEGDEDPRSFHLGAFLGAELISVATFLPNARPDLSGERQYQLRGMATAETRRGSGAGTALIRAAVERLQQLGADLLWCNARKTAVPFYQRCGFNAAGVYFELPGIGPHLLMYKKITPRI